MLKNVSLILLINVSAMVLAYPLHWTLANYFGAAGYGQIALFLVWTSFLRLPFLPGLGKALLKFVSIQLTHRAIDLIRKTILTSILLLVANLLIMCVLSRIVVLYVPHIPMFFKDHWTVILAVAFTSSLMLVLTQLLRAFGSVGLSLVPQSILQPILLLAGLVTAIELFDAEPQPNDYFYWYFVVVGILTVLMICLVARAWFGHRKIQSSPQELIVPTEGATFRSLMSLALPLSFAAAMYVLHTQTDMFLLSLMTSDSDVGLYGIAARVSQLIVLPLSAVVYYVGPHVATLFERGRLSDLQRLIDRSCCLVCLAALPLAIAFSLISGPIMSLFGTEFRDGANVLVVLCVSQSIISVAGLSSNILNMTGYEKITAYIMGMSLILNIILNIVGIYFFGVIGAAVATTLSVACWNLCTVVVLRTRLNLSLIRWVRNPLRALQL